MKNKTNNKFAAFRCWLARLVRSVRLKACREQDLLAAAKAYRAADYEYGDRPNDETRKVLDHADTDLHFAARALAGHIKPRKLYQSNH